MPKIKTRETRRDIKVLDKAAVAGERMKSAFIRSKDTVKNVADDGQITPEEYAENHVQYAAEDIAHDVGHTAANQGIKLVQRGRDAVHARRDHPRKPEQSFEYDAPQAPAQEAARQSAFHKVESRAAEQQPEPSFFQPVTEAEQFAPDTTEYVSPIADSASSVAQEAPLNTLEYYSVSTNPARTVQYKPDVEPQSETAHGIETRNGYEQSSYHADTPSPAETKHRVQQILSKQRQTTPVSENSIVEAANQPLSMSANTSSPVKGQVVRPHELNLPAKAVGREGQLPSVYSDHSHFRFSGSGKEIRTYNPHANTKVLDVKRLTPTERGRQFAIKQAEQRAETVRVGRSRSMPISEVGDVIKAPIEAKQASQPVFSRVKQPQVPSFEGEARQCTITQEQVKTDIEKALRKPDEGFKPVHTQSDSAVNTDYALSKSLINEWHEQKSLETPKIATRAEKRQAKGSIKTVETTEKTIKQSARSAQKTTVKTARHTAKTSKKAVKTAEQTSKTAVKTAQATAKATQKSAQAAVKAAQNAAAVARETARVAVVTAKAAAKAIAASVKAIIVGVKELIAAIAAGGWVAVVVVIIICLIGLIITSPFGIFFSGDNRDNGAITASAAVAQVNYDFCEKLETLQDGEYDAITVSGSMADWPEVLAVFAVKVAGKNDADAMDVATLDEKRVKKLKEVFWDMNTLSSEVETIDYPDSDPDDDVDDSWTESILHITIISKTAEEMKTQYHFSEKQITVLDELLDNRDALLELIGDLQSISADATDVIRHLPDDLSEERRKVIKTACSLVGKVNYFWGGKSLVIGWDSRWGSIQKVWADGSPTTGTYRPYGLDCSGFVDWVFYNVSDGTYVIGHGGGAADQHYYCRGISWDDAMPGDLVFFPENSHVGIVAGRDDDGELRIIHCGGNGVVVSGSDGFSSVGRPLFYST